MAEAKTNQWVATVHTDSTHPPEGLFNKSAATIARVPASRKVSPKGPVSGLRMLIYFINRGGKGLSAERRAELEKAKEILSRRIQRDKKQGMPQGRKAKSAAGQPLRRAALGALSGRAPDGTERGRV